MNKLNNIWTCWIHLQNDTNWDINSYRKITTFDTLEKCIIFVENFNKIILKKCMVFIMRDDILPLWENISNIKGGCFSYKISNNLVCNVWNTLCYYLIGQTIHKNTDVVKSINGISISPKKNFCIIKLWLSDINNIKNCEDIYNFINNKNLNEFEDFDPFNIHKLCNIEKQMCVFKKHELV